MFVLSWIQELGNSVSFVRVIWTGLMVCLLVIKVSQQYFLVGPRQKRFNNSWIPLWMWGVSDRGRFFFMRTKTMCKIHDSHVIFFWIFDVLFPERLQRTGLHLQPGVCNFDINKLNWLAGWPWVKCYKM